MTTNSLTVMPFLLAMFAALASMGTNVYQICAWNAGTLEIEPWLQRTGKAVARALMPLAWLRSLLGNRRMIACAALLIAMIVSGVNAEHAMAFATLGTVEPTLVEVKSAIETQNRAFEEFKRTNDQRLAAVEAGKGVDPTITAKLAKIEADLVDSTKITDAFAALEAKFNRLRLAGVDGAEGRGAEAELKSFNLEMKSNAQAGGRSMPSDVSLEDFKAYKKNFGQYLRRGDREIDVRSMSVGSDPDGGYLVTPDVSGRIVKRVYETSPIRQIANVQTIGTDKLEGLRDIDEASGGGWVAETGGRTATTTPQIGKWDIPVHEQYENPGATQKLIDDASINVEAWLAGKVADRISRRSNTAFVTGNGVGKPRGFASYTTAATADASRAWGILEHVFTGTSGGFGTTSNGSDKLISVVHSLKAHYRAKAQWVMSRLTVGEARKIKDATGAYVWLPSMVAGQPSTLLGYGVTEAEDMAAIGADSLSIAFGDFDAGYQVVDRIGIRVLRDPYTNKPYVHFYTTARVGGDVIDFEAIKFLKFGTS